MKDIQKKIGNLFRKKPKYPLGWAIGIVVICVLWIAVTPVYSEDIDNYVMALVANKMFTGEEQDVYINYLNPLLCLIFQVVLKLVPAADCFTLTAIGMLLCAVSVIAYLIAAKSKNYYEMIGYYSAFFALILFENLFSYNFTRWAAFLTASGMLVLLLFIRGEIEGKRWIVISAALLCFGLMWRYEAALLFVPFICLDVGIQFFMTAKIEERKKLVRRAAETSVIPMLCLIVVGFHFAFFSTERYHDAKEYDDARSEVLDYPLQSWEQVKEEIPEITENDYYIVLHWNFMDTDRIDTQFFEDMLEAQPSKAEESIDFESLVKMQKKVVGIFLSTRTLQYMLGLTVVLFVFFMASKRNWYYKFQIILAYLGTDIMCLYFVYAGRALERVFISILYALLTSIFVLMLEKKENECGIVCILIRKLATATSILGMVYCATHAIYAPEQFVFNVKNFETELYSLEYEDEELYFWDITAYKEKAMCYFMNQGKLISSDYLAHNIYAGAWTYGQVYFQQFLDKIGVENPMRELLENEKAYYVAEDSQMVLIYLQEHYDERVMAEQVKEIDGISVWRFYVTEAVQY